MISIWTWPVILQWGDSERRNSAVYACAIFLPIFEDKLKKPERPTIKSGLKLRVEKSVDFRPIQYSVIYDFHASKVNIFSSLNWRFIYNLYGLNLFSSMVDRAWAWPKVKSSPLMRTVRMKMDGLLFGKMTSEEKFRKAISSHMVSWMFEPFDL